MKNPEQVPDRLEEMGVRTKADLVACFEVLMSGHVLVVIEGPGKKPQFIAGFKPESTIGEQMVRFISAKS